MIPTAATPDAQRRIANRLKRARGQLDAVIAAVEAGGECRDVVTQLAATSKALDRAGFAIVASAMEHCVADDDERTRDEQLAELEKLFLSLS
ncbi:metal-sensitive transcriptional regulator [Agrococcus sp. SL85]|uniref:metal-sensitive transcriptional regulator n=1 Tax=Agrococcus sp. SL85 TaxID=2995141 RepID=UPI00226D04F7|nr:metal-sensitive transcriptional regulator [Agrococcus sp. SL85]WAC66037.1 metal-sensitive transcriptional regulator [Agrococcus sp. SL85]